MTIPGFSHGQRIFLRGFLIAALLGPSIAGQAAESRLAAVVSAHPMATAAGREILERGGNAFDAAIAVTAALAVVEPYASGLGGGGFFLLHRAANGRDVMVDAREVAPGRATPELYVGRDGKPVRGATTRGGTAAGIPGTPAALAHLAERYGMLPLAASLAPAVRLARDGFAVDERYARNAAVRERYLDEMVEARRIFLDGGHAPRAGWLLRQPDLAATLERLGREGRRGFYAGPVARALVQSVNEAGGVWRSDDLEQYQVIERSPLRFRYRGATITTVSLPSAGGIALAQCLQMLEPLGRIDPRAPQSAHVVVEALRRAFHDRALYLGDPAFTRVPVERLISASYAARLAASIHPDAATPSASLGAEVPQPAGVNTTHLSVIDADGNRVAATVTINLLFGSGVVARGTGVLLNNEMDDFTLGPELPNAFRLRGGAANAVAPGKRPLSSMTPTFVEDDRGVLALGAPGGSRIVSQVLLAVLDYLGSRDVDLVAIAAAPRYHHQWWPDRIEIEPDGFPAEWRAALEAKGHRIEVARRRWGNLQLAFRSKAGAAQTASDPRGADVGGY